MVDDFDLQVRKGEFVSLIGHSGCGKSTVLSMVAGLNDISGGGIVLDGQEVDDRRPRPRGGVPGAVAVSLAHGARERRARRRSRLSACDAGRSAPISSSTTSRVGLADAMDKRPPNCRTA